MASPIAQVKVRRIAEGDCHRLQPMPQRPSARFEINGHLAADHGCFDRPRLRQQAGRASALTANSLERRALQTRGQKSDKEAGLFRDYLAGRPYRIHRKLCGLAILYGSLIDEIADRRVCAGGRRMQAAICWSPQRHPLRRR